MGRVVLVMHAPLGTALARCAAHVLGEPGPLCVIDVDADADPGTVQAQVLKTLLQAPQQACVVLSDLYGATPFNIAQRAVEQARTRGLRVALLGGTNLNMVLKALTDFGTPDDLGERVLRSGLRGIASPDGSGPH